MGALISYRQWKAALLADALNRQARSAGALKMLSPASVYQKLEVEGFCCCECGKYDLETLTLEHVYPLGRGRIGRHELSNVRAICARCRAGKPHLDIMPTNRWSAYSLPGTAAA